MKEYCSDTCKFPPFWYNSIYLENGFCCQEDRDCISFNCHQGTCRLRCYDQETHYQRDDNACCENGTQCNSGVCMGGMCVGFLVHGLIKYPRAGFQKTVVASIAIYAIILIGLIIGCHLYMRRLPTL